MESDNPKLTEKQELFCRLFASDREFFGNGTQSYIEAYNIDVTKKGAYAGARANASQLLTKTNILEYIDSILETAVLNDEFVDKQIAFLISQNADFGSKMAAIKEYNALKQRVTKKLKVEIDDPRKEILDKYLGGEDARKIKEATS
jgi:phage terminase small subunit